MAEQVPTDSTMYIGCANARRDPDWYIPFNEEPEIISGLTGDRNDGEY